MLNIFKKKKNDQQDAMNDLFGSYELQSFPAIIMEVLTDLRDPDQSLSVIARKLEGDPGMTVKILKTVNVAGFGLSREVTNLHTAISMTGHVRLETILLTHAVKGALPDVTTSNFSMKQFWTAAAQRACLARAIALQLHPTTQIESFTAGLLQDMAVPILVHQRKEIYSQILETMQNPKYWLHQLETDHFSFDHAALGGFMAREWKLPAYLIDAIAGHHQEGDKGESNLEPGVRLASLLRDRSDPASLEPFYEMANREYNLNKEVVSSILKESYAEAEEFAKKIS